MQKLFGLLNIVILVGILGCGQKQNDDAQKICSVINSILPEIKRGSLRFWGEWFGRPYDNFHTITKCESKDHILYITFDRNEKLTIANPKGFKIDNSTFQIKDAQQVIWEWYYYGKPMTPENLYREEFVREGDKIKARSNVDWYTPDLRPKTKYNAVEIL